jgi:hypothetical protein
MRTTAPRRAVMVAVAALTAVLVAVAPAAWAQDETLPFSIDRARRT